MIKRLLEKYPIVQSSKDPQKVSLFLTGLIPFALLVTSYYQLPVKESDLIEGANQIGLLVSGIVGLWGLLRKFI